MAIVISDDIVLSEEEVDAGVNANNPRIGWHNLLTVDNVTASASATGYPVANLANPATSLRWKGTSTSVHTVQITLAEAEKVNYFGLVGHNFGTDGTNIKLQSSTNGSDWTDVTDARVLANDFAFMEEFADVEARYFRLHMTPQTLAPQLAVLHIGRVLRMPRRLFVGYKPPTLNRNTTVSSGHSESGQFLGRVKRRQMLESDVNFENIKQEWVRSTFEEFMVAAETKPYFFAWRPGRWPNEVAYMWSMGDIDITNQLPNGMVSISWSMQGIR